MLIWLLKMDKLQFLSFIVWQAVCMATNMVVEVACLHDNTKTLLNANSLARSALLPKGLYVLLVLILFFIFE